MRIAFSGAHRVGKSTLIEAVADALGGYKTVDEPYYLLEEDGYEFADPPSREDFEAQLECSLSAIEEVERDVLFDRCPLDLLAYLLVDDDEFDAEPWLPRIRAALRTLDMVVFVPIEARVAIPAHEDADYRSAVDDKLRELLVDDVLGLGVQVLTIGGDLRSRIAEVVARMK